jgi:hypothetical protein
LITKETFLQKIKDYIEIDTFIKAKNSLEENIPVILFLNKEKTWIYASGIDGKYKITKGEDPYKVLLTVSKKVKDTTEFQIFLSIVERYENRLKNLN